ncbi:Hypothetical predicted protein [Mytilus galloprovincialis]|uniref:Uncharacterized protein n=1 Tax=Mytilus galloprovincialis TaxID=29158 RepID=A0A8B6F4S2_MYTGA|nr:Hypothetical predicted protein [Mytilus galloprovincialis]
MSLSKHTHPWVNTQTRRLSRSKARAYRRANTTRKLEGLGTLIIKKTKSRNTEINENSTADCNKTVRETAYRSMVRPSLEYASAVCTKWKAYVCNDYRGKTPGCVTNMIQLLKWELLQDRRKDHRLLIVYKANNGMISIPEVDSIINKSYTRTRGANRLRQIYTITEVYRQSFFPRTIQNWNQLPTTVTNSTTLDDFKASLQAAAALRTTT